MATTGPAGRQRTVLLVDDDEDFLAQTAARLRADGFRVIEAPGQAAAEAVVAREAFDLAVVDLMMENMDSGFVVCHQIKRRRPGTPVILCTGVAAEAGMEFDARTAEERAWVNADVMLPKPIRHDQLRVEIARLLPEPE